MRIGTVIEKLQLGPEIRTQLKTCNELLVLWTPEAEKSKWVSQEIGIAYGLELHIVPIRYCTDATSLPPPILEVQSPELTEGEVNKYLRDLAARARMNREKR